MHVSIMDFLGDPANPLYAEPHSMSEHYDAMLVGARALGDLPGHSRCRDLGATARVHEDEAQQVCQKILRCLDMRVMDGDLVVPTCLRTPMLIPMPGPVRLPLPCWRPRILTTQTLERLSSLGTGSDGTPGE